MSDDKEAAAKKMRDDILNQSVAVSLHAAQAVFVLIHCEKVRNERALEDGGSKEKMMHSAEAIKYWEMLSKNIDENINKMLKLINSYAESNS